MINDKLQSVCAAMTGWCDRRNISYDWSCDEDDLQCIKVFRKHNSCLSRLRPFLAGVTAREGVHMRPIKTRSGTVFAFSLSAISEDIIMGFSDSDTPAYVAAMDTALEAKYTFPSRRSGIGRSTWPNFDSKKETATSPVSGGKKLLEASMQGIAAEFDPNEVRQSMSLIMQNLGLSKALADAGIKNKLSEDGLYVVFYVINQDGAPQPIIRYELTSLGEEAKMYEALDYLADLAKRKAPGTSKQDREKRQKEEKKLREVIKANLPQHRDNQQDQTVIPQQSLVEPTQQSPLPVGGAKGGGFSEGIVFRSLIDSALFG